MIKVLCCTSQVRCTKDAKEFYILKFRSMRVDAEKDGVARLAAKNEFPDYAGGKFIRAVRIDELPQLFNILKGECPLSVPDRSGRDHPRIYRRNAGVRIPYQSEGRACGICARYTESTIQRRMTS